MPEWVFVPLEFEPRPEGKSDVFVKSSEPFPAELGQTVPAKDSERQAFFEDQLRRIAWHLGDDIVPVFLDFNGDRRRMDKGCVGHAVASGAIEPPANGADGYVTHVKLRSAAEAAPANAAGLWQSYLREQIPTLFGHSYNAGIWQQGFIVLGHDVFLLVTLDKSEHQEEHRYDDGFLDRGRLRWQSQNRTTQSSRHGKIISQHAKGFDIHLFVRRTKKLNGKTAPFRYCGDVDFVSWHGEQPITVEWQLRTPLPTAIAQEFKLIP
jgi:hypothetical protein